MDARTIYTTPSEIGSFTTAHGVRKNPYLKQTKKEATNQLKEIESFVRHTPVRKTFPGRRYIVKGFQTHWQSDLAVLDRYRKQNSNFRYILGVMESLSKKVYLRPLKKKTAAAVQVAFSDIVREAGYTPKLLHTDKGKRQIFPLVYTQS